LATLAQENIAAHPELTVIGVTGSQGKTTVKDLLAQLITELGPTVAPTGSFNNELGHPITVLRINPATRYLVLELGSRGIGHITQLTQIAPLRIGAVLNVGLAHVGEFGSLDVTAQAKSELITALPSAEEGGVAVLNADDPRVASMAAHTKAEVLWFGRAPHAEIRAEHETLDELGRPTFDLVTPTGAAPVKLQLFGAHQILNALAAAAVCYALAMPVPSIAARLSAVPAKSAARMAVTKRDDDITIINDAYNANPDSMRAALRALVDIGQPGKTWAVLGYLAELGESTVAEHEAVGQFAANIGVDNLVVIDEAAAAIYKGFTEVANGRKATSQQAQVVPDKDSAIRTVLAGWGPGDTVLVKASNSVGLWTVADSLLESREQSAGGGQA
jgi:UDP-N-acetylmuramoyl-tripeptide--D-alanyl-D-alanine ligase